MDFLSFIFSEIFYVYVVMQSLWNLREFREEFTSRLLSNHKHIGIPCAVCSLYDIFAALSIATADNRGETVAPKPLVIALRTGYENTFLEVCTQITFQF